MRDKNNLWTRWLCWYLCFVVWGYQEIASDFIENAFIASLVVFLITLLGALLYSKSIDYIIDKELSDTDLKTIKILNYVLKSLKEKNKELQEIKEENERLKDQLKNNK